MVTYSFLYFTDRPTVGLITNTYLWNDRAYNEVKLFIFISEAVSNYLSLKQVNCFEVLLIYVQCLVLDSAAHVSWSLPWLFHLHIFLRVINQFLAPCGPVQSPLPTIAFAAPPWTSTAYMEGPWTDRPTSSVQSHHLTWSGSSSLSSQSASAAALSECCCCCVMT